MGKRGKERAQERRDKRLQEIAELRTIPYAADQRWWSSETVAVVTGSNRGIGYEIARQLLGHGLRVVVTARDADAGRQAVDRLRGEGHSNVDFHQLDITDGVSIEVFAKWILDEYGGLDVLVNNAGVNYNVGSENSVQFAEKVILTNYFGPKLMTKAMVPLMKPSPFGARILNVSSRLGRLNGRRNRLGDADLREQLSHDDFLTEDLIDSVVAKFLQQVKDGSWDTSGCWPQMFTDYSVSKLALSAHTRFTAKALLERPEGQKIYVNCYCPGWVKTAMTGWAGNMSAEEGADTGVWTVLLSDQLPTGKFFAERREINF